jgi:outer membrane protein assembly factor BamB
MGVDCPGRRRFLLTSATVVGTFASGAAAQEGSSPTPTGSRTPTTTADTAAGPLATDWPSYQYDAANTGTGVSEGPVGAVRRRWRAAVPGEVLRQPVVAGDTAFVVTENGWTVAVDAYTGEERWRTEVGDDLGPASVAEGRVVVAGSERLVALDAASGDETWSVELPVDGAAFTTVVDGTVYAAGAGIGAYSAADGSQQWRVDLAEPPSSPPAVVDGTVYVGTDDGGFGTGSGAVLALDATDLGRESWRVEVDGQATSPAVADGTAYLATDSTVYALATADGHERWTVDIDDVGFPPTVHDGTVYLSRTPEFDPGEIVALAAADGTEQWRQERGSDGELALAGGTLYHATGGDPVAATGADGTPRWEFQPENEDVGFGRPVVAGGLVIVGTHNDAVYGLESPRTGARLDIARLDRGIGRARAEELVVDEAAERLERARSSFDVGSYDTAGQQATDGLETLRKTRVTASAARNRIDRLSGLIDDAASDGFDTATAEQRLSAARTAFEDGDYAAANESAASGLELLTTRRERAGTADERITTLADMVESDGFDAGTPPARLLAEARDAREAGSYEAAITAATRGITAVRAKRRLEAARSGPMIPGAATVADILGRAVAMQESRREYRDGDYQAALDSAESAAFRSTVADGLVGIGGLLGTVVVGYAAVALVRGAGRGARRGRRAAANAADGLSRRLGTIRERLSGAMSRPGGGLVGSSADPDEAAHDRAVRALDRATEAVGFDAYPETGSGRSGGSGGSASPSRPSERAGFAFPGHWTDRRVQCPGCRRFASTEGGDETAATVVCSNCGWVGNTNYLVRFDHYDIESAEEPVRPSTAALVEARYRYHQSRWEAVREQAERAIELAEAEADAVDAIEDAMAAIEGVPDDVSTETAADRLAAARAAVADESFDVAERQAREAEQRAGEPVGDMVESARDHAGAASDAAERDAYAEAVEQWVAARREYERARDRAAETGDEAARADATAALDEVDRSLAATRLSRIDDAVSDAYGRLEDAPEAAEEAFRAALDDLEDVDADVHADEFAAVRERARRGVIRAGTVQGRELMAAAEAAFDASEYREAREGFDAAADHLEDVLARAADYDLDDARDEVDALVETCRANAGEARRALFDVETVEPSVTSADDAITAVAAETDAGGDEAADADAGADTAAAAGATAGTTLGDAAAGPDRDREPPAHERVEHLGSGGAATVHRVELADGGEAALKTPRMEGTLSAGVMEAFVAEAETWSKLDDHPNVVTVEDWGTRPYPWLLLEYLPGGNLADRQPLEPTATREALVGVCEAVHHAHTRGVAHADLKPENVLFDGDGRPEVGDWGLANRLLDGDAADEGLTPAYAAPEQLRDGTVGTATDIYQLGVVTYEALTGQRPFDAADHAATVEAVLDGAYDPPTAVDPSLPDVADEVVATAMATDPAERYESVVYLRDALEGLP